MPDRVEIVAPTHIKPPVSATVPASGMVLAAGLGRRMAPLSNDMPKALVPVAGRALVERVLDRFHAAGLKQAVINLHAHADMLERHLRQRTAGPDLIFSDERAALLETGGGVRQALDLIPDDPFYVANCDALWLDGMNDTLQLMAAAFDPARMDALLLIIPAVNAWGYGGAGDFVMAASGQLARKPERAISPFVYGGVAMYTKAAIADMPLGQAFSLNRVFDRLEAKGRLFGVVHEGRWAHVGTPDAVAQAERRLFG